MQCKGDFDKMINEPFQEASNAVYHNGSIEKINDFKYPKVYFGSPTKMENPMKLTRELFVTPYIGIASIFAVRPQHPSKYGVKNKINRGYDEWDSKYKNTILKSPLKELHVRFEGAPYITSTKELTHGYIHEITITPELKKHIYRSSKMNQNDFEFCIDNIDEITFSKIIEVDVMVYIRGVESSHHTKAVKSQKMISLDMDIDNSNMYQEGMFNAGFSNLRAKIAQALKDKFNVTNVVKGMGGKDKFDITEKESDNDSIKTTVESTGNGCKVISRGDGKFKCHFNNIALSQAFDKIIELFEQPELLLENAFYDMTHFSRSSFFIESDDNKNESDDEENDTIEFDDLDADDDSTDNDDTDRESDEKQPDEEDNTDSLEEDSEEDDIDDDMMSFGMDTSDIQNEFNQKDVDYLNKLIAAESEAINEYFDGAKDTNDENLRRLYGDIGHEERFHLEQLLYAKSTLTGEKYEPRDPEVKKEYEELLAMGMDDDTACCTAIDKACIKCCDDIDTEDDSDMDELTQEASLVETLLYHNEILASMNDHYNINKHAESIGVFIEAFFQEEMGSVAQAPKNVTKLQNPITFLLNLLKSIINGLLRIGSIVRDSFVKNKVKRHRKLEWIRKHGIGDLFKNGIYLYFYNDQKSIYDINEPVRYVDMLYRMTKMVGQKCGIKLNEANVRQTINDPIRFNDISRALNILNGVVLTKTKVVVTEQNKDMLTNQFFGYSSDKKIDVSVSRNGGPSVNDSANIYNRIDVMSAITKEYCQISIDMLQKLKELEGQPSSVYYKNRSLYNSSVSTMKEIVGRYNQFIKCMAHDLKVMLTLDNGLLEQTRQRDEKDSK